MDRIKCMIPEDIFRALLNENINSLSLLLSTETRVIEDLTNLSAEDINEIKITAAEEILNNNIQTADKIPTWERIKSGCENIDLVLRGGFPVNGISEIYGCSGVGKTQLCLQLALQVQLPIYLGGKEKGVVYISTEDIFPHKRLNQLSTVFKAKYKLNNNFEDHIYLKQIADSTNLLKCLELKLPNFMSQKKLGLLIIDSIAGVFRSENENANYISRSQEFMHISRALHNLQDQHNCAIVIVNQVTDNISTGTSEPCLGLAWSNNVTCRFAITRYTDSPVRKFEVIFAPDLPSNSATILITPEGISNVD